MIQSKKPDDYMMEKLEERITALENKTQKEIKYNIVKATDSIYQIQMKDLEIGGIYEIAFSYNFVGSPHYRSVLYAILSIPVGYSYTTNPNQVVVRPKLNVLSNFCSHSSANDTKVQVICEGGVAEKFINDFVAQPQLYLYFSAPASGQNYTNYKCKIRKLN